MVEITLLLPDSIYYKAKRLADLKRRPIEEVLIESITLASEEARENDNHNDSLLKWAGKFSSQYEDLAENHDYYIGVESLETHE